MPHFLAPWEWCHHLPPAAAGLLGSLAARLSQALPSPPSDFAGLVASPEMVWFQVRVIRAAAQATAGTDLFPLLRSYSATIHQGAEGHIQGFHLHPILFSQQPWEVDKAER